MAGSAATGAAERANCNSCGARVLRWAKRTKNFPMAWFGDTKAPGFSVGPTAAPPREWTGLRSCFSLTPAKQNTPACARAKFAGRHRKSEARIVRYEDTHRHLSIPGVSKNAVTAPCFA